MGIVISFNLHRRYSPASAFVSRRRFVLARSVASIYRPDRSKMRGWAIQTAIDYGDAVKEAGPLDRIDVTGGPMTPKQKLALENLRKLPPESRKKVAKQILQLIAVKDSTSSVKHPKRSEPKTPD